MEISDDFIRQGPNTLRDLHNPADKSQPHSIIAKYAPLCFAGVFFLFGGGGGGTEAGRGERRTYILTL